nr:hypothetical protein [Tanacetum cinerariifolium]
MDLADDELVVGKNHTKNDWVERHNLDNKLPNFNTRRIVVSGSQSMNEYMKFTEVRTDPESSNELGSESLTPLSPLKNLQGASPSFEVMPLTYQDHSPRERPGLGTMKHTQPDTQESSSKSVLGRVINCDTEPITSLVSTKKIHESKPVNPQSESSKILYCMKCKKEDHRTSDHNMYVTSLKSSENFKVQPYKYASPFKQILKAKAKPYLPCIHCGFNDHQPGDCHNYPKCAICGSYDHFTSGHNRVILFRGVLLAESS